MLWMVGLDGGVWRRDGLVGAHWRVSGDEVARVVCMFVGRVVVTERSEGRGDGQDSESRGSAAVGEEEHEALDESGDGGRVGRAIRWFEREEGIGCFHE